MRFACLSMLLLPCVSLAQVKGTDYAFIVAVKGYDPKLNGLTSLPSSIKDVQGFKDALLATGYAEKNIILMHDELSRDEDPRLRFVPKHKEILTELKRLLGHLDESDSVVVVLNGHGVHFAGARTSHFCPWDADLETRTNLVPLDGQGGLYPMLAGCKAKRKLLIAGMCRNDPGTLPNHTQAALQIDLETPERVPEGIAAFYSCDEGQRTYFDPKEGSYFFKHLNAAWRGQYSQGNEVALDTILQVVTKKVKDEVFEVFAGTRNQHPVAKRQFQGFWVIKEQGTGTASPPAAISLFSPGHPFANGNTETHIVMPGR